MFDHEPTILRVGAYSVDPVRFAAIVDRHPGAGPMLGTATRETGDRRTDPAAEWAVKQAVLRALGAPIRLRARWPEMEASQDEDGRWRVTSRGPVRQFHEAHTLGHVDVTVTEADGRITAFAVLTRDLTMPPSPLPGPADLPDRVLSADVNGPTDPTEY